MRKILLCTAKWLLISLFVLGFGASVKAEDYGLAIAGVPVTSDNYTNLAALAPGKITLEKGGYFAYDPENKILTMRKVTIKADTDENAIFNRNVDGLRIVVAGKNTLDATTWAALNIWRPTVLHGTGKLVVKSTKNYGIYLDKASLTISDIVVEVSGRYGISGESTGEKVEVNNATVTLNGTSGATADLDGFDLVGCQIVEPAGAAWSASDHAIMVGGVNPKKVKIAPTPSTRYDLSIAGVAVTNKNCNDLSKMPYVNSAEVFTYDPNENVLTLKNVKMRVMMSNENAIFNEVNGLKIVVIGENTLDATTWAALNIWRPTVLHGTGKLVVSSMENYGIFLSNTSLTISDIVVEASGKYGISGDSNSEKVEVNNAIVTLNGTSGATVRLGGFDLVGCQIVEPAGAAFDADKHAIMAGGVNPKKVEIKPAALYALKIAGIDVTEANCTDLSGIAPGKVVVKTGGQFKYDPQNKILTLKGVTIESDTEIPIHNEGIEGLKIRFFNANTIKSANKEGILILKDTEFQGDGKLIVETPSEAGIRVNKNAQLTISTIIEVSGQLGISGTNATSDESLKLNKTAITAKGTGTFAIGNFSTCILRDCRIASPAKGKWDDTQRTIVDATNTVAQEVKIVRSAPSPSPTPDPNAVEDAVFAGILVAPNPFSTVLRISNVERTGIRYSLFDAQGISVLSGELPEGEISLSTEALPAGLYLLQLQTADGAIKHWRVVK